MPNIELLVPKMEHAIETSFHKYGNAKKTYPELAKAHECIAERLDYYVNGRPRKDVAPHNKDYLVDVANFAMLEAMYPEFRFLSTFPPAGSGWQADFSYKFISRVKENDASFRKKLEESKRSKIEELTHTLTGYQVCGGPAERLLYIAWLAAEEFAAPTFEDAFYDRNVAGANLSPGLAGGISYKQLMEGEW